MKTEIIVIDSKAYDQLKADLGAVIRTEVIKLKDEMARVAKGGDEMGAGPVEAGNSWVLVERNTLK